ncbi:hypothetical protein M9Y10_013327 [Tritrichomonas musculus]|uniref:MatE family protein n=1 Tax=Tritrichomonas musculus TaxID=1915356 RepID=A0ABR2I7J6_9EUKA
MEKNIKEELLPNNNLNNDSQSPTNDKTDANASSPLNDPTDSNKRQLTEEDIRLGGKTPLRTVAFLSVGPLISQLTSSLYGVINTIWISKALGDPGLTAIAAYQNFDTIGRAFAAFLQVSATTKIASLFGEGLNAESSQVFTDLLRFSVVFSIITPALFIPISKICVAWFGAEDSIVKLGFNYIVPNLCVSIVPCIFLISCGCLQAEGRSWLFSLTQIVALCLNMFVFCPLFLLGFKIGIAGAAIATGLSELLPALVVITLYYRGKFGIKPKFRQMFNKFSPHSFEALKLGLAQLFLQISWSIPGIWVRKLIGLSCAHDEKLFSDVMAGFNTANRIWPIEGAVPNAINIGFIPAAAYANGAKRYKRIIWLLFHALWISVIWCSLCQVLMMGFPIPIAKIFSKTPNYLHWAKVFLFNGNIGICVSEVPGIITSLLQAMKKGTQASILSFFVQMLPVPVSTTVLYLTNKHNIARLIYCYPIHCAFGLLVSFPIGIVVIREILRKNKEQKVQNIDEKDLEDISVSTTKETSENTSSIDINKDADKTQSITSSKQTDNSLKKDANGNDIEEFHDHNADETPNDK